MKKATVPQIAAIVAALGYLISPIDLISDAIPIIGYTDDAGILLLAATTLTCCSDPEVIKAAKDKLSEWLGSVGEYFKKLIFGKNMKMVVLGKAQAGKTSFYNFLKDEDPGNPDQTPVETIIEKFDAKDSENHIMTISSVIDISGQWNYVAKYYKELVEKNDVILFFFNSKDFMTDEEYMIDVVDLIAMISIYDTESPKSKEVHIVPTFKDEAVSNGISDNSLKERLLTELNRDYRAKKYAKSSYILSMHQTNDISSLTNLRDSIFSSYRQNT
jgi:GTPase SAR1 family protein